ncbi:WD40 repeat-like protein [Setomelanomma holmii]|uniref:WD40 repeat-like protein n=1 Tax=Setomelanomma holmii TaxID=210430 RepID=A0A9P4GX27_9PLEO|nr:WD40 repeat-like protein [Setomelanomma holmii]
MSQATAIANSNAGLAPNSYIYKVISTGPRQDPLTYSKLDRLAIISSDDSLRFLDPQTLNPTPDGIVKNANEKVTCLERANDTSGNVVATAGRDGFIRFWDKRTSQKALEIESPHKLISALVCDAEKNSIAAGIENPDDGPGVSPVYVCTDGLINLFDTSQAEEDDALYQVINHRSAIAHAGFMYPGTNIYALGTDETMSFYALQSQKEEEEEPTPKAFGDVREPLGCEYLVDMHWVGSQPFIAAGKHSRLDLIPITKASGSPLQYDYDPGKSIQLPGGHGEEIVRDLFTDVHTRTTYTCGEDGHIRAWKLSSTTEETMDIDEPPSPTKKKSKDKDRKERRKEKKEKRRGEDQARYKPY